MTFREWLPITRRNRVALAFAFLGLLCAIGWNFLPWYYWSYSYRGLEWITDGNAGCAIWPLVFSASSYQPVDFSDFRLYVMLKPLACVSLLLNALTVIAALFLWEMIHVIKRLRTLLAIAHVVGGVTVILLYFVESFSHSTQSLVAVVVAFGMFSTAISLFLFKNELALRSARNSPRVG
jgi:hypothetical protein